VGERGLAEAGRAVEEEVVERFVALLGGVDGDAEVVLELLLADELVEAPGPESSFQRLVFVLDLAGSDALGRRCRLLRMLVLLKAIIRGHGRGVYPKARPHFPTPLVTKKEK